MDPLPQDHFRLLYLEPGDKDSEIHCRLAVFELQSAPTYEALSYTWGEAVLSRKIICNGSSLQVTSNLHDALQYLRQIDGERIVWIDAVCINQTNDQERTAQVKIMKNIYSNSDHVVIWLGKDTADDKMAFAILEQYRKLFAEHGQHLDIGPMENVAYKLALPAEDSKDWTALMKLFQKPWFQRIWVIQETVMARRATVACEPFSASWDLICDVAESVLKSGKIGLFLVDPHAPGVNSAHTIRALKFSQQRQNRQWTLIQLLRSTRKYKATDPRDKVFALQGVMTDTNSFCNTVTYGSTMEQVYLAFSVYNLQDRKDLVWLSNAGLSTYSRNGNLPSWVPDWSHDNNRKEILASTNQFRASGETVPSLSISSDHKVLTIRGFVIDSVAQLNTVPYTHERIDMDPTSKEAMARPALEGKAVVEGYIKLTEPAHRFPPNQTREEALWRTMCCDLSVGRATTRAPPEYGIGYRTLRRMHNIMTAEGDYDWAKDPSMGPDLMHVYPYANAVMRLRTARKVCLTSNGYMGGVVHGSAIGDKICILFGASVPFVLRERDDGGYMFVGEAYVHGLMDGEALEEFDIESLSQDFKLH